MNDRLNKHDREEIINLIWFYEELMKQLNEEKNKKIQKRY